MNFEEVKNYTKIAPSKSGIYKFIDEKNQILYVGKAKNLKKRISSYSKQNQVSNKTGRMIFLSDKIEFMQTENETEALLLEYDLIKKFLPKFNILLRDDKTFPYIQITNHDFPRILKYRGFELNNGKYFGPFVSASDVDKIIDSLRKKFLLRNCSDNEFKSRKKPCLEYQIKKCSAPCVGLVTKRKYNSSITKAIKKIETPQIIK